MTPIQTAGEEIEVALPWPDRAITPNGRGTWQKRARLTAGARKTAWALTLGAIKSVKPSWAGAELAWTLHPKTANFPDDNNAGGYVKAYCDGIADALGINDRNFRNSYRIGTPIKGGAVLVTISEAK